MRWRKRRNICGVWDCNQRLPDNQFLCPEHYRDWEQGAIDRCPECGRFKDVQYYLCQDDYFGRKVAKWEPSVALPAPAPAQQRRLEYSQAWTDGYMQPGRVFIYILELADGGFYVGSTRNIQKQFSEHRNDKIRATAGRNPKLRYLEVSMNQKAAELRQDELERLTASNPSQIHLMFRKFHDHMAAFGVEYDF